MEMIKNAKRRYDVDSIRRKLGVSQEFSATLLGVSRRTWVARSKSASIGYLVDFVVAIGGSFDFKPGFEVFLYEDRVVHTKDFIVK